MDTKLSTSNKYVFFLGGQDLEMETIREILANTKYKVYDNNLEWGAKLSSYKNELKELSKEVIPVLIELELDFDKPKNTKIIDHHNDKEDRPSSLEQIAKLLGIELSRKQQLIAANDKGYIPAMECLCATGKEINDIRTADRKAQGVTEEDERLARESIATCKKEENGITIIKSLTDKFSPITDRMYGKTNRLLIYTDIELTYYGTGKKQIVKIFEKEIEKKKAFHGGGDSGFFGLVKNNFKLEEIIYIKNEIISLQKDRLILSHHIFLFPFKWDIDEKEHLEETSFKERVDLKKMMGIFNSSTFEKGLKWNDYKFNLEQPRDYNEYTYFYEHVRTTLFDDENENLNTKSNKKITQQYLLELDKSNSKYIINICKRNKVDAITYELSIEDIILNFYSTGVGILSFHLSNYEYKKPEQILDINDFGRRIYPQYLDDSCKNNLLKNVKKSFLANSITLIIKQKNGKDFAKLTDDFSKFNDIFSGNKKSRIRKLPKFIIKLFGNKLEQDTVKISPIIDDRMFTICWYGNDYCARKFSENKWNEGLNRYEYNYEKNELWNRFIFVDNTDNSNANKNLLTKQNIAHTYDRWINYKTFYGISRYSFILLTNSGGSFILPHIQTMYFQMVMLALLQRSSLIRFSDEATKIQFLKNDIETKNEKEQRLNLSVNYIQQLYESYLHFVNKIFFREPTAQEQGIELYDMLLDKMRIEREVKDLNRELDEVHKYITLVAQEKQNDKMNKLTILGTIFLPLSIFISLFQLLFANTNHLPKYFIDGKFNSTIVSAIFLIIVLWGLSVFGLNKLIKVFWKRNKNE
ncbi:MAG: hypothetical protein GY936_01145 [Ignavibacteriae bacterium]|nr:hypothetical protein [Ignavibacteriota bacterium]